MTSFPQIPNNPIIEKLKYYACFNTLLCKFTEIRSGPVCETGIAQLFLWKQLSSWNSGGAQRAREIGWRQSSCRRKLRSLQGATDGDIFLSARRGAV